MSVWSLEWNNDFSLPHFPDQDTWSSNDMLRKDHCFIQRSDPKIHWATWADQLFSSLLGRSRSLGIFAKGNV